MIRFRNLIIDTKVLRVKQQCMQLCIARLWLQSRHISNGELASILRIFGKNAQIVAVWICGGGDNQPFQSSLARGLAIALRHRLATRVCLLSPVE